MRRFRSSLPHAEYFITRCTDQRRTSLTNPTIADTLRSEIAAIEQVGYWTIRGALIMPDHVHFLAVLHEKISLGRAIARLKSKSNPSLKTVGLRWQGNYYEHQLRNDESVESVLHYIYLNPYRACLLAASESYPHFWLGEAEAAWFKAQLDDGHPFPEWLR